MAARRGICLNMESLEMELDRCTSPKPEFSHFGSESVFRLTEDYRSLCREYEQLSAFQRFFLSGQARQFETDASTLEHRVREFYNDTWVSIFLRICVLITFPYFYHRKQLRLGTGRSTGSPRLTRCVNTGMTPSDIRLCSYT